MQRFICFFMMLFLAVACSTEPANTRKLTADSLPVAEPSQITRYSPKMQLIFRSDNGVVQGIRLGDTFDKARKTLEETDAVMPLTAARKGRKQVLTAKVSFTIYEDADIAFLADTAARQITEIRIATYLNSQAASDSLKTEMSRYFSDKYGKLTRRQKKIRWQHDSLSIELEDVGVPEAPGLQVRFRATE